MVFNWPHRKEKPDTDPVDPKDAGTLGLPKYLQAWNILRNIPIKKLFPAVLSVSTVVFFAISGLLAWLVLICSFVAKLFKIAFKWLKIWP